MTKISQLSSIGDSLAIGDQFLIRDIDDAGSPNKSVTVSGITRALADGDATAPALAFAADKNTGIYRAGTDSLAVATNGVGRLFVNSSGQVGIGTSSPNRALVITSAASEQLLLSSTTGSLAGIFFNPNGSTFTPFLGATGESLVAYTLGAERLRITSAGLVGIGTGVPGAKLESYHSSTNPSLSSSSGAGLSVNGTSSVRLNIGTSTDAPYPSWLQASNGAGVAFPMALNPSGGAVGIGNTAPQRTLHVSGAGTTTRLTSSTTTSTLEFETSGGFAYVGAKDGPNVYVETNGSERARIDSSGRLGIGTSSPGWLLSLRQDSGGTAAGTYPAIEINNANAVGYAALYLNSSTAQAGIETKRDTAHLGFYAGGAERARFSSSGQLGIGTNSPGYALDVVGTVN